MSYSLNTLKGGLCGTIIGVIKGDTRSLDHGPYAVHLLNEYLRGPRPRFTSVHSEES